MPERSGTPGTSYVAYRPDSTFYQFITFDKKRISIYSIYYGKHQGLTSSHAYFYENSYRTNKIEYLNPGHELH